MSDIYSTFCKSRESVSFVASNLIQVHSAISYIDEIGKQRDKGLILTVFEVDVTACTSEESMMELIKRKIIQKGLGGIKNHNEKLKVRADKLSCSKYKISHDPAYIIDKILTASCDIYRVYKRPESHIEGGYTTYSVLDFITSTDIDMSDVTDETYES